MVCLMLRAFVAAGLTDLRAHLAHLIREATAARHEAGRKTADRGAVDVECDALRHHADVLLLEAGGRAAIARIGARIARIDAGLVHLSGHVVLLSGK